MGFVKYLVFVFNLLCACVGVVLIGLGSYGLIDVKDKFKEVDDVVSATGADAVFDFVKPIAIGVLMIGIIIFIISFLGCCGAIKESKFMLIMYAFCMIILLCATCYILHVVKTRNVQEVIEKPMDKLFQTNYHEDGFEKAFHKLESTLHCCGTTGPSVYTLWAPASCCKNPFYRCLLADAYDGCAKVIAERIEKYRPVVEGTLIGLIVFKLLAISAALYLTFFDSCKQGKMRYF
ncbi:hypothetical protein O0L34_g19161 [Tuta absoluta]|nr:hypothetical protein O0L34_g19161 [Tuta absoluta]